MSFYVFLRTILFIIIYQPSLSLKCFCFLGKNNIASLIFLWLIFTQYDFCMLFTFPLSVFYVLGLS